MIEVIEVTTMIEVIEVTTACVQSQTDQAVVTE